MTTIAAPGRTLEQRQTALKKANLVRVTRAALKKNIAAGVVDITDVLRDPPPELLLMRVYDLLRALPKFGPFKAGRVMTQARIAQSKTVGGLSARQRDELLRVLA